jgi:hypothetical protein
MIDVQAERIGVAQDPEGLWPCGVLRLRTILRKGTYAATTEAGPKALHTGRGFDSEFTAT